MAGGFEVLGDFLLDQAGQMRADRKQKDAETRQERLVSEQREYARGEKTSDREYARTTKLEDEKRAYADGLIAAGLLSPAQRDDATAVAAAWAKTTPEYRLEFKEKLDLREELKKYMTEGIVSDVQIFENDVDTLRTIVEAARAQGGQQVQANRTLDTQFKQSQIDENRAQSTARVTGEERAQNSAYWIGEATAAYADYQNAQLDENDLRTAQAAAAQAPGAETSPDLYRLALQKASEAILKNKRSAAYLRAQSAEQAARYGAARPAGPGAAPPPPPAGASVMPSPAPAGVSPMQGFFQSPAPASGPGPGASVMPAAPGPSISPPPPMPPGGYGGVFPQGASVMPLPQLAPLAPIQRRFNPLAGSSVGNPYA